ARQRERRVRGRPTRPRSVGVQPRPAGSDALMTSVATYSSSLNSLLAGMLARTPGSVHAVLATVDGVSVAVSAGLPPERAEQLATIRAGLPSSADPAGVMMNTR